MADASPSRLLAQAGREVLRPMGLKQRGRSRTWLDDHDWWVVVVEFQPSAWSQGSHLNVGVMWLWSAKDFISFDFADGGSPRTVGHIGFQDQAQFAEVAHDLAETAAEQVNDFRERFSSLNAVSEQLTSRLSEKPGVWDWYHAAVAAGLAGDVATSRGAFEKVLDERDALSPDWLTELCERIATPYHLLDDRNAFRSWARAEVLAARELLKLGPPSSTDPLPPAPARPGENHMSPPPQ
ncbi:hypothetical protein [Actinomadura rudentiformis]|uniref:DUF4304 domain-containing protein n=1 Tax=Actinomadura rudentiformis TaxID=359158 RepID=A0A6H9YQV1_9ACTN|nr:hypothetical protein [Actinomadura rudentiformis]KAB2347528.1 hypothetical protein F8566_21280 [Actinomadura rudentiformis]